MNYDRDTISRWQLTWVKCSLFPDHQVFPGHEVIRERRGYKDLPELVQERWGLQDLPDPRDQLDLKELSGQLAQLAHPDRSDHQELLGLSVPQDHLARLDRSVQRDLRVPLALLGPRAPLVRRDRKV